jgi:glycosyltransferase involved in cell wall biosynthesis
MAKDKPYDYVFVDRSVFGIIAKRLKQKGYKGKVICFFHNVEVPYFKAKIGKWAPQRQLVLRVADKNDAWSCKYADKIIALNKRDEQEIARRYGRKADVLIPVAFKDRFVLTPPHLARSEDEGRKKITCLFIGAYFKPNNDGITWFVKNVLPHVDVRLNIVGKGMAKLQAQLPQALINSCQLSIHSDVPDLTPFFEEADVVILPIFEGAGMKVKTAESLMYGKNILATAEAFEGYELDFNKVGGLCNAAEEFIAQINDFIAHPRPKFNEYSRMIFLEKYSEEAVVEKFRNVLLT